MGMEQFVKFPASPPAWPAVRDMLVSRGHLFQIVMIDGELAFPDEQPPETWRELRLRGTHGMVTVRRDAHRLAFVIWGNADAGLVEERNALARVFAECGGGEVEM